MDFSSQDAAGLDMFVGSGLDFLSEVTFEDLQTVEPGPSDLYANALRPEPFANYAPMAASLGPPGAVLPFSSWGTNHLHSQPAPYTASQNMSGLQHFDQESPGLVPTQVPELNLQPHASNSSDDQNQQSRSGELRQPDQAPTEGPNAQTKVRDKNKRAQKRFREKKKEKAQETEKHLSSLQAELEQLQLEKNKVEERNSLLEKVLSLNKDAPSINTEDLFVLNEEQIKALPNPFGAELDSFPDPDQMLPVSVAHSDSKLMAIRDIKAMSWEQHLNLWKDYVSKLAVLLADAKNDAESKAGLEVQSTLSEAINVCACKAVHDQYGMEHFMNARMEESRRLSKLKDLQPQAMSDMTAGVLNSLRLSEQQKSELMQLRSWVLPQVGRLMQERERISRSLQTCTSSSTKQAELLNSNDLSQGHMQAADILAELYANLKEDSILMRQMSAAFWRKMMTPFQMANIIVQFYPWAPDTGEILNQLAAQRGEPHASDLLGFSDTTLATLNTHSKWPEHISTAHHDHSQAPQLLGTAGRVQPDSADVQSKLETQQHAS